MCQLWREAVCDFNFDDAQIFAPTPKANGMSFYSQ